MEKGILQDKISAKFQQYLASMMNLNWVQTANERTIDDLFKRTLDAEEIFIQDERGQFKELVSKSYPSINFNRFLDVVLENIIKSQLLDENLTLYAIKKYMLLYSEEDFVKFLENMLSEVELRCHAYKLIEDFSDVDLDFFSLNKILFDVLNSTDLKSKVESTLKSQTLSFLKAIKYGEILTANFLICEIIHCLEVQTDLRLWFTVMKENNLITVLDLCTEHSNFFKAILRFFDKFAEEIESNYDEELNVQYSHVNLDFEDFVKVLQLFLNETNLKKETYEFLDSKTLKDKNFCFWIDVKACL